MVPSEVEIDPGTIFLGMVIDTLSGRSPLYRRDEFFESQDTELLLGKKVGLSSFSDRNVARVMDKAYEIGTIKIFSNIAANTVSVFGVNTEHVSFDTTSVSVQGDVVIHLSAHDKRRQKRIDRQLETECKALEKQCKAAAKNHLYCESDDSATAQILKNMNMKYYQAEIEIELIPRYKRGRPKGGVSEIKEMRYRPCFYKLGSGGRLRGVTSLKRDYRNEKPTRGGLSLRLK